MNIVIGCLQLSRREAAMNSDSGRKFEGWICVGRANGVHHSSMFIETRGAAGEPKTSALQFFPMGQLMALTMSSMVCESRHERRPTFNDTHAVTRQP